MRPSQHTPNTLPGKGLPLSSLHKGSVEALVALAKGMILQSSVSIDTLGRENKMTEMKSGTSAGKLRPCCLFYTTRNVAKDKTHLHKSQGVLFRSLLAS